MIRIICLCLGLVGIILTAKTINHPFWNQPIFGEKITEMQKEGNYLPYRMRKIIWSKETAIVKVEIERIIDVLWLSRIPLMGLILIYPLFVGINNKVWPEIIIILMIISVGVMENNPNISYFINFTFFPLATIIIKGIKGTGK